MNPDSKLIREVIMGPFNLKIIDGFIDYIERAWKNRYWRATIFISDLIARFDFAQKTITFYKASNRLKNADNSRTLPSPLELGRNVI